MTIISALKSVVYHYVPKSILNYILGIYTKFKTRKLRKIVAESDINLPWLNWQELDNLYEFR